MSATETPDGDYSYSVRDVSILCVNGSRFAEFAHGANGKTSVLLNDGDEVASLFKTADELFESLRKQVRQAHRIRNAAWQLSKQRALAKAKP